MHAFVILALVALSTAVQKPRSDVVAFDEAWGPWRVVGDPGVGACLVMLNSPSHSKLTVASFPSKAELDFALSNPVWKSLSDNKEMRLSAVFLSGSAVTDAWSLSSRSYNNEGADSVINWTIGRAANDNASFIDQFARSTKISFFNGKVPVAAFDLAGSGRAIERLKACPTMLRADPEFDPFAGN